MVGREGDGCELLQVFRSPTSEALLSSWGVWGRRGRGVLFNRGQIPGLSDSQVCKHHPRLRGSERSESAGQTFALPLEDPVASCGSLFSHSFLYSPHSGMCPRVWGLRGLSHPLSVSPERDICCCRCSFLTRGCNLDMTHKLCVFSLSTKVK